MTHHGPSLSSAVRRRFAQALLWLALAAVDGAARAEPQHAIAMHGAPALAADARHLPYVNPDAPKGGQLTLGINGTYDSLNPFIVRGVPAAGLREYVYESLLTRSADEPFTLYRGLAEAIDVPADRAAISFRLDAAARFSDGKSVTADDLLFSFEVLRERGRPNHRAYFKKVMRAERVSEREVRFVLDGTDRELPLILGLMPVLPKHRFTPETFERTTLEAPIGSGPYTITRVDPGRGIVYKRNADWWGRDLPVNRGRFNFDEVRFEYFRDSSTMLEAFKSGDIDFRLEEDPARWAGAYDVPALADGRIVKREFSSGLPVGMTGLVFNTRRGVFKDARVRAALIPLFDFPLVNRTLYHGLYKRTDSYFERSDLASAGRPAEPRELALLAPYLDRVAPAILDGRHAQALGEGADRETLRTSLDMLKAAGYELRDGRLVDANTGAAFAFEILATAREQERIMAAFAANLKRIGIAARVRLVDSAQYQARLKTYDFDMVQNTWATSLSPGNEQLFRWASAQAKLEGTYNYAGVADAAVDQMIGAMLKAETREDFVAAVRALDRLLLSGHYVVPLFHVEKQWVAFWRHLRHPATTPLLGYQLDTWWSEAGN